MPFSYKTSIAFGLVYIPIKLHACIRENDIGFNMLDKTTMSRIKYKKTCAECEGREVSQSDILRGYQYEKDKYIIITDEELEKIKTKGDKSIIIESFVDLDSIDPIYFDRAFYVEPTGAQRAYKLLLTALEQMNKAGIARTVLGSKEVLVALRIKGGKMLVSTLFFDETVQRLDFAVTDEPIQQKELELAKTIIQSMTTEFEPAAYKNEYRDRLLSAIEQKISGKEIHAPKEAKETNVASLMDALKMSLASFEKSLPKQSTRTETPSRIAAGSKSKTSKAVSAKKQPSSKKGSIEKSNAKSVTAGSSKAATPQRAAKKPQKN